jgi:hypothetical protein
MRIAICFSGGFDRFDPANFATHMAAYQGYTHCDLFFSHNKNTANEALVRQTVEPILARVMKGSYAIAGIELTDNFPWQSKYGQEKCWSQANNPAGFFNMFYGIRSADRLRQKYELDNNFKYDAVVRSRTDIALLGTPDLPRWVSRFKNDTMVLFCRNWNWFSLWDEQGGMLSDQWFAADSDTMTKVTNLVDYIDNYTDAGCRFHPESLLWWHARYGIECPLHLRHRLDPFFNPYYGFERIDSILRGADGW